MALHVGDKFPSGVEFKYIPIDLAELKQANALACSTPLLLSLDKVVENGAVVIVSVPGAFTPTCTENHIPPYLDQAKQLAAEKGIKTIIVTSANDAFVLNAWGKLLLQQSQLANGDVTGAPKIIFASDPLAKFSQAHDLSVDATANGLGIRTARYAIVVDGGVVKYLGKEVEKGVHVSGVDSILSAKL